MTCNCLKYLVIFFLCFLAFTIGECKGVEEFSLMCGPNTLWLAARSCGVKTTLKELRYFAETDINRGTPLHGMMKALREVGLEPLLMKTDFSGLDRIGHPVILVLDGPSNGHYTFLEEINSQMVKVIDPPERKTWTRGQFMKRFTGYAIVVCQDHNEAREFQQQLARSKISLITNELFLFSVLASTVVIAFWILRYHGRTEKTS